MPQLTLDESLPWQRGRVVVVDDNAAAAHMLADFLVMIGHTAEVVSGDSTEAIAEAIVAARPDVVFLDILLGRLDGNAVARAVRERGSEAYLVAVTGWGEPDDASFALQTGFDDYWTKPLDTSRVEVFMRERPLRRAAPVSA